MKTATATVDLATTGHCNPSAKFNSVRKLYANLSDTPAALASASKYFQMLLAPPGALQNALRLCKRILTCS
jgi:hypothetical protein